MKSTISNILNIFIEAIEAQDYELAGRCLSPLVRECFGVDVVANSFDKKDYKTARLLAKAVSDGSNGVFWGVGHSTAE